MIVFAFLLLTAKGKNKLPVAVAFTAVAIADLHPGRLLPRDVPVPKADAQEQDAGGKGAEMLDVRMFTVGPVAENCFIVREPGATGRADRRSRR